jgi:DNA-binding response OmpR family regulator
MPGQSRPTILVVEDDDQVRNLISTTLAAANYRVLEARGGLDGMSTMLRYDGEIALAVVEIKMPGINGMDLANQIGIERPTTDVLYISDLTKSVAVESIAKQRPEAMLPKPFTARQLLARVRQFIAA